MLNLLNNQIYPFLFRNYLFPLWNFIKHETCLTTMKHLNRTQWYPREKILQIQLQRLRQLLEHAYSNTNYYDRVLKENGLIPPFDNLSLSDFSRLPILTKSIIQEQTTELIAKNYSSADLFKNASGGSTGHPTIIYQDHKRRAIRQADAIRHDAWTGWRLGEKSAILWGAERDIFDPIKFKDKIRHFFTENAINLNAFDLTKAKCKKFVEALNQARPTLLIGYAGALNRFAQIIKTEQYDIHSFRLNLKGIVSSAETLSYDTRNLIESVFKIKVFDRYGSREVGLIASECKVHNGMHINAEHVVVEIVDNDNKLLPFGQIGDVIVTDLINYGMPIIRYKLGDRAALNDHYCKCGRGLPLMSNVVGRITDFFIGKNGEEIHGEYFTHLLYGIPQILQFQFVQEDIDKLVIKLVAKNNLDKSFIENLKAECGRILGDIHITIEYLDKIPPAKSGKYLFTISHVNR